MTGDFKMDVSSFTGEPVRFYKVKCKCGHVISFISNHKIICRHCGAVVYPSKRTEFKEKLTKEMKKR